MALTATYDATLSRVRLSADSLDDGSTVSFERSLHGTSGTWTVVRGGGAVTIDGSDEASWDDYEFVPGVLNYYRAVAGSDNFGDTITPNPTDVWFKSISRPWLNRAVNVIDYSDIIRPARNGVFEIVGRSYPVAVTDVRSSRRWTMNVKTETPEDADALEVMLSGGDPLYIQIPGSGIYSGIPGGYVVVGDMTRSRFGHFSDRRYFDLPMTVVAPPGPDVVGTTVTWESLVAEFGSWTLVLAEFGSWQEVADHISDEEVIIVD